MINIFINGNTVQSETKNLLELLSIRLDDTQRYAVAVNEYFIPKSNYLAHELEDGDKIEIVAPMQGG